MRGACFDILPSTHLPSDSAKCSPSGRPALLSTNDTDGLHADSNGRSKRLVAFSLRRQPRKISALHPKSGSQMEQEGREETESERLRLKARSRNPGIDEMPLPLLPLFPRVR